MAAIVQAIFKSICRQKVFPWFKFLWCIFLRILSTLNLHWFRAWIEMEMATSHCLHEQSPSSFPHVWVTRLKCVKINELITRHYSLPRPPYCQMILRDRLKICSILAWKPTSKVVPFGQDRYVSYTHNFMYDHVKQFCKMGSFYTWQGKVAVLYICTCVCCRLVCVCVRVCAISHTVRRQHWQIV